MRHYGLWFALVCVVLGFLPLFLSLSAFSWLEAIGCHDGPNLRETCLDGFPAVLVFLTSFGFLSFLTVPMGVLGLIIGIVIQAVIEFRQQRASSS